MITDAILKVSTAQAVTASAVSTNTIDGGAAGYANFGDLQMLFMVDTTAAAAGAATVTFQIIGSAAANLSSPVVLAQSDAIPKAELVAGRHIAVAFPGRWNGLTAAPRYIGANYLVATGPLTAGAFSADVVQAVQSRKETIYPAQQGIA